MNYIDDVFEKSDGAFRFYVCSAPFNYTLESDGHYYECDVNIAHEPNPNKCEKLV